MTTHAFLSELLEKDIKLWVDGERLRYSAPQGVMTPALQTALAEHKKELISYLQSSIQSPAAAQSLESRPARTDDIPLSFSQQRLWFMEQLAPGSSAYNMLSAVRLIGRVDIAALERGFQAVVQRHESLRTTFASTDGQPRQVIAPEVATKLALLDISALDATGQEAEVKRLARVEAGQPFDLAAGPLVRCRLLRLSQEEHVLLVTMHHIVSDGWSMGVLFREIVLLGQAFAEGREVPLAQLPLQYADFAIWQRNWLRGDELGKQLGYWKAQLADAPDRIDLPTDRPRPVEQTYRGAWRHFKFGPELSAGLRNLSRQEGATLFMTLFAGFDALLWRYSGQTDIVVGSPVANRNRAELEGLIGFFVNNLVLRVRLSKDDTYRGLLANVKETCLKAYQYQDLPFEKVVEELRVKRDLNRNPLFQVMFILQNTPLNKLELGGLQVDPLEVESDTAQFDLRMSLRDKPEGLRGYLEYNTDLFDEQTIGLLLELYEQILSGLVDNPEQLLEKIALPFPLAERAAQARKREGTDDVPATGEAGRTAKHARAGHSLNSVEAIEKAVHERRPKLVAGRLAHFEAPRDEVEEKLAAIWSQVLHLEQVGIRDNFFEIGGDSLLSMRILARAHQAGLHLSPQDFFEHQTIAELAAHCKTAVMEGERIEKAGLLPLTIAQHGFFSEEPEYPNRWNLARLIEIPAGIGPQTIEQVVRYLWTYHDALRTRFVRTETGWRQMIDPADEGGAVPFAYYDFSGLAAGEHIAAIEQTADELQDSLNIQAGPLLKVALFDLGPRRPARLFVVMHHLVYDMSSGVFFDDFFTLSQQLSRGEAPQLPGKTTPIWQWLQRLDAYAHSAGVRDELDYWLALPWDQLRRLPLDYPDSLEGNLWGSAHSIPARLSPAETEILLRDIPRAYGLHISELLIAALAHTITKWSDARCALFNAIDFGRNAIPNTSDLDLSRTIGWFSMSRRLVLDCGENLGPMDELQLICEQLRRAPNRGLGFEVLLYASEDPGITNKLGALPGSEIMFNYLGSQSAKKQFTDAYEYTGALFDPRNKRPFLLDCSVSIWDGSLISNWKFSRNLHKQSTIKQVADEYIGWLRALIAAYTLETEGGHE